MSILIAQHAAAADDNKRLEAIVNIFDEVGVLTPPGHFVVEPSFQYAHSSATTVAIEGFTIIPAIVIGLVNLEELQRDTYTAAVGVRYGISSRWEVEAKFPYVYREEEIRGRRILEGSPINLLFDSNGSGMGDAELAVHYQINSASATEPVYIANFRYKTTTGDGPYEVKRELIRTDDGTPIAVLPREQPTGSGFDAYQISLTGILPAEPAAIYGNISYLKNGSDTVEELGKVTPGDNYGLSFGVGIALNDKSSISFGYDHTVVEKTDIENDVGLEPSFDRLHVGNFLVGFSYAISPKTAFNVSLGIGVTDDASDVSLNFRMPMSF